ncbi:MAG: TonB family protein [Saprospiraceae bacterium]|nr:TonB family protein [Saprospiraceae bacterium]
MQQLLRALRSRDLTAEEWALLSSAAAADPFLADAIEGLRDLPARQRQQHLAAIAQRLQPVERKSPRRALLVRVSAAAGVFLIVATSWFVWQDRRDNDQLTALTRQEDTAGESSSQMTMDTFDTSFFMAETDLHHTTPSDLLNQETSAAQTTNTTSHTPPMTAKESPALILDGVAVAETETTPAGETDATGRLRQAAEEQAEGETAQPSAAARQQTLTEADRATVPAEMPRAQAQITGIVQDERGDPLIGAMVQIKGTPHNAVSDYAGNFRLEVPTAELYYEAAPKTLVVSHVGFESLEAPAGWGDSLVLQLNTAEMSMEEVVTGYRSSAKSKQSGDESTAARALARPVGGERRYQRYLRQNLRIPEEARQSGIHGTVELEFTILENGRPGDIRVVRSLGYGCDEEAIRLVEEGPDWDYAGAQVPVARVSVKF